MADTNTSVPVENPLKGAKDVPALYSNNVQFESNVWDLKLLFGQLDQSQTPATVEQRAAITIPWRQAKLLAYLLEVILAMYELEHGPLTLPPRLVPPLPDAAENDSAIQCIEYLRMRHEWFFGKPPEPAPAEPQRKKKCPAKLSTVQ